jgi:hypothetical protein
LGDDPALNIESARLALCADADRRHDKPDKNQD